MGTQGLLVAGLFANVELIQVGVELAAKRSILIGEAHLSHPLE